MLRRRAAALGCAALLTSAGAAHATGPAAHLAHDLKRSMQAFYDKTSRGLELTTVTCHLNAAGTSARCDADFTFSSRRLLGVFQVRATINRSTGEVHTRTVSALCRNATSGAPVGC